MTTRALSIVLLLGVLAPNAGCARIGPPPGADGEGGGGSGGGGSPDPGGPGDEGPDPVCLGDGQSGGACEVTGDCDAPLVCLDGACVGPRDPSVRCDPIEGIECEGESEVCVAGTCVLNPGSCETVDECPNGYLCEDGACVPERGGESCPDPGPGPDLSGTWEVESVLHLREGLPGVLDSILDATEEARDLINGDVDFGLPSIVEFFIGGVIASIVDDYVPPWAQDLITVLGDLSDVLDDMRVESTVTLEGQPCEGEYRGTERWDYITFEFRGNELRVPPDRLPGVEEVVPDDFSATYSCGELYLDRHRIRETMGGLVRFLVDNVTNAVTGYPNVESALYDLVDCYQVGVALDNYLYSVCSYCPVITGLVEGACNGFKIAAIDEVSAALDEAAVKMSLIKRKGVIAVESADAMASGSWYGSLVGGDFPGEFSMTRD